MTLAREPRVETHLRDYVRLFWNHRWLIMGIFFVTAISSAIWTSLQVQIFKATATVLINPEPPKVLNIQDVTPLGAPLYDPTYFQTQYRVITSHPVAEKAAEALNLRQRIAALAQVEDPYLAILSGLKVEPARGTRLVHVSFEHSDPVLAADVANAVTHAYAKYNLEIRLKGARDALAWLHEQVDGLKQKAQESAVALQNYRVREGILGLQEQRQLTAQKIMDFTRASLDAQAQRLSIEARLRELTHIAQNGQNGTGARTILAVADSPLIQKLKVELAELAVQRSKLLKTYKEKHPEVLKIDAQIKQLRDEVGVEIQTTLERVQTEHRVAKAREETLLATVNRFKREGQDLGGKEIEYLALQRENDFNQQLHEAVLKRLKETGVAGEIETNNVTVVEQAKVPSSPVRPRGWFNLVVSVVLGLVLGAGAAVAAEYFDTTVRSVDKVESYLGLRVIAVIPDFTKQLGQSDFRRLARQRA